MDPRKTVYLATPDGKILSDAEAKRHTGSRVFIEAASGRILSEGEVEAAHSREATSLVARTSQWFTGLFKREPTALAAADQSNLTVTTQKSNSDWGLHRAPNQHGILPGSFNGNLTGRIYRSMQLAQDRVGNHALYREMCELDEHLSTAGQIYADYTTRGDSDADEGGFEVQVGDKIQIRREYSLGEQLQEVAGSRDEDKKLQALIIQALYQLRLREEVYGDAYNLFRFGESWREMALAEDFGCVRYAYVNPTSMWLNLDKYGSVADPNHAYFHVDPRSGKVLDTMAQWQMIHYRLPLDPSNPYGTSLLRPARGLYKKLKMMKDSLVVARLHRAPARYVFVLDVPGGRVTTEDALAYAEDMRSRLLTRQTILGANQLGSEEAPLEADFDFFLPQTQGGKSAVQMLSGDTNVSNLADIEMFIDAQLATISMPQAYVGRGDASRGEITQQEVNLMRRIRNVRAALRPGIKKALQVHIFFLTRQWIPDRDIAINFPELGMVDALRQAQIKQIEAAIASVYQTVLKIPSDIVNTEVLGFDRATSEKIVAYQEKERKREEELFRSPTNLGASRPRMPGVDASSKDRPVPVSRTRGLPGGQRAYGDQGAGERTTAEALQLLGRVVSYKDLREGNFNLPKFVADLNQDPQIGPALQRLADLEELTRDLRR